MLSLALAATAVAATAPLHPDSLSSSVVAVDGGTAQLRMRCQVISLLEVLPELDANGNGVVETPEVDAAAGDIGRYIGEHYSLFAETDRELLGGVRLEPGLVSVLHRPESVEGGPGYMAGSVEVELVYTHSAAIRDLVIESVLFLETSPEHIDLARVVWAATEEREAAEMSVGLSLRMTRARFDPEGRGAFGAFVGLGWDHILGGWDHLAFVVVLVLSARRLRSLLGVVTAFTVAHSLTLGLSALDAIDLSRHAPLVEALVALSIAYVAADVLVNPNRKRARWIEAFLFGLVHGLGFAGFLAQSLVQEQAKSLALLGFNVGVELGQLVIVLVMAALLRCLPQRAEGEERFLAPLWLRRGAAAVVLVLSLVCFFQRI